MSKHWKGKSFKVLRTIYRTNRPKQVSQKQHSGQFLFLVLL